MQKTVESIQSDLDNELTLRQQAVRAKSKLEADLADIEVQLGHANHQAEQAIRKVFIGYESEDLIKFLQKLSSSRRISFVNNKGWTFVRLQRELKGQNTRFSEKLTEASETEKQMLKVYIFIYS